MLYYNKSKCKYKIKFIKYKLEFIQNRIINNILDLIL